MRRWKKIVGVVAFAGLAAIVAAALALRHAKPCPGPSAARAPTGETMRALLRRCYGSPDVATLERIPKPEVGPGQLLVRVRAAAANPVDWHGLRGEPYVMRLDAGLGAPADPRLGVDFAGVVEAVGAGVERFRPGDAVFGGAGGSFADYVLVRESRAVVAKPANVSFEDAAAVPVAGTTALQALRDRARVRPGHQVLVNGASGGVGTYAVQIAANGSPPPWTGRRHGGAPDRRSAVSGTWRSSSLRRSWSRARR